ncbi:MAG: chromosome partitioning protein [Treponema sp.]|jgi:phage shock protein A|nr:chromosome partitioning protein [Treponema sp.]
MNTSEAKGYVADVLTSLKLMEKQREELASKAAVWESRIKLAQSKGEEALMIAAQREADAIKAKIEGLDAEIAVSNAEISSIKQGLSATVSRERSIDTDILQQELLIAAGHLPGDEDKVVAEQGLSNMENEASASAALAQLKVKMGR